MVKQLFQPGHPGNYDLYKITISDPCATFYGTSKRKLYYLAESLARITPPCATLTLARVHNPCGRHHVPWSTVIYDRSRFTRSYKHFTYTGPPPAELEQLDTFDGRANFFTPKEKARTYRRILEYTPYLDQQDLAVFMDYVFMNRSEVPLGRDLAIKQKRYGRPPRIRPKPTAESKHKETV